jgi:AcrR family transcriptional regulator
MPHARRKTPRRRPRQARSLETANVILDAAAHVLLREGYARATTNRIARRAGVSVGSIYQYFAHKNAIFEAVVGRYFDSLLHEMRSEPLDPARPLRETIQRLVAVGLRAWPRGREVLRILEQVPSATFRARARWARTELQAFLRGVVALHRDELRVRDVDQALWLVVGAADGMLYEIGPQADVARVAEEMAAMFARYLLRDDAP